MNEAQSPRGRIQMMLAISDGIAELTPPVQHALDTCLDCRACETACPSSVVYHELIEEMRGRIAGASRKPAPSDRVLRSILFDVLPNPDRMNRLIAPLRLLNAVGVLRMLRKLRADRLLPARYRGLFEMLPDDLPLRRTPLPNRLKARGKSQARVVFFSSCVGQVFASRVDRMSVELLAYAGADVRVVQTAGCCGAIHHHNGRTTEARDLARRVIDRSLSQPTPDFIVANVAGCGAMLLEYDRLLREDKRYASKAVAFASRVRDVTSALVELGLELPPNAKALNSRVTLHDACHLAHAQRVTDAPRKLLSAIPGLTIEELHESDTCCGAAGTYNLLHPEMARAIAERKLENIRHTHCHICVSGNAGCTMHLAAQARRTGTNVRFVHPVELLYESVFGRAL
jgi:glycolate oxidase iron-sulfur subunit